MAFGIDAWYESRVDQAREEEYQRRIAFELGGLRDTIERMYRSTVHASDVAVDVTREFYSSHEPDDPDRIVTALYNVGRDHLAPLDMSNYEDLVSTGSVALISDLDRRQAIQRAYANVALVEQSREPHRDEYLTGVRGWIPQEFIDEIQTTCPDISAEGWECPAIDFDDVVVQTIVRRASTDEAFLAFQLRRQGLDVQRRRIERAISAIDEALAYFE